MRVNYPKTVHLLALQIQFFMALDKDVPFKLAHAYLEHQYVELLNQACFQQEILFDFLSYLSLL